MSSPLFPPSISRRACLGYIGAATLAGCGQRGVVGVVPPSAATDTVIQKVIVATSRKPVAAPEFFSSGRDFTTHFAEFSVSIPTDRKLGTVSYPGEKPDPHRDFLVTEAEKLDGPRGFVGAVNRAAAALPQKARTGALIVHGFNTNFAEGLMKTAQLNHDLQAPGVHVMFSWPSEAHLMAYIADRENALFSRDALAETLRLMSRTRLRSYNLVAHSMGTFLVMETLRTMALSNDRATLDKIGAVVLISADLQIDVFRKQAVPVLAAGVPIYLLVSDDDRALGLSAKLRGESRRVGSVRSREELGGLDVAVIDLTDVNANEMTGHLKVGTSPELIALIQKIRQAGVAIFDEGQKVGLLDQGAIIVQDATGMLLNPIGP